VPAPAASIAARVNRCEVRRQQRGTQHGTLPAADGRSGSTRHVALAGSVCEQLTGSRGDRAVARAAGGAVPILTGRGTMASAKPADALGTVAAPVQRGRSGWAWALLDVIPVPAAPCVPRRSERAPGRSARRAAAAAQQNGPQATTKANAGGFLVLVSEWGGEGECGCDCVADECRAQ
jgi:hypothetical protein